jgi:ABC-type multidrug transport system fused ATPase/permease subunit
MNSNLNIAKLTLDFFKTRKTHVLMYLFFILAYPLSTIVVPHYFGKLLEILATKKGHIFKTFLTTLFIWIISVSGTFTLSKMDSKLVPQFRSYLYTEISKYIFEIHKEDYANIKIGELVSKLSKIPYLILEIFYQVRSSYMPLIYMIIFCLIYFTTINAQLGLIIFTVICLFGYVAYRSKVNCMPSCVISEASSDTTNENLQDILENILSVYSANNIEGEIKILDEKNADLQKHMNACLSCASNHKAGFSILYLLSFVFISYFVYTHLYKKKKITLAQTSSVLIVTVYLLSNIDYTMQYSQETISYIGSIIDIQNYINKLNTQYNKSSQHISNINQNLYTNKVDLIKGKIEFQNINLCFGTNCVLKDFNYTIEPGKKVAIIGKVGSGKSSLLKMILKLSYPNNGQVLIDGMNLPYDVTRDYVSYIGQTPILFNRSLYDNIVYGTKSTKSDVNKLLKEYNLEGVFGNRLLSDNVGKGGSKLSGGQRQIVIILRTMLRNTPIILLDEPTTALDDENKKLIMDIIFKVFKAKTIVMITHDNEIINRFDHVLNLSF